MRKAKFFKKLNNRGSSLMFVLIAIAFVSILTAVIISAATTNYRLKVMHNRTQKTFYNAEIAVQEVYAGFGKETCDTLEECYLSIAKNLTTQVNIEGVDYAVNIDNVAANKQLRRDFFSVMNGKLNGVGVDRAAVLTAFLTDPAGAKVVDAGTVTYRNDDDAQYLIIEDVVISYKEGDYDYFSNVAVDIHITYPDEEFDFISNTKSNLQTFLNYSIIAMDGIKVGDGAGSGSNGSIAGGVFAGDNGIIVDKNSKLTMGVDGTDKKSTIVTTGDVKVGGEFVFNNGDMWCDNFTVGSETEHSVNVVFQPNTRMFVSDDLNIEGNECTVVLGKEYIGYGNNGSVEGGSSSAIVINGRSTDLKALSLSKFVLAGRAYINFESEHAANYMTADSLGLKGAQKIYYVPYEYMSLTPGYSGDVKNPTNDVLSVTVNLDNFFARELLADVPYRVVQVEEMFYFYLNFKDTASQRAFVKAVVSDTYFASAYPSASSNDKAVRNVIKDIVTKSMGAFTLTGVIDVGFDADAKYYTAGNLYEVTGGSMSPNENSEEIDDIAMWCSDKNNRFAILKSYLYDIAGTNNSDIRYAAMPESFYILGTQYSTADVNAYTAYERILDIEMLSRLDSNYVDLRADGTVSAVIVEGTYTVPDSVTGGVIVAYNEDVVVKNSFEGLILTNGKVTTITDAGELITNGVREVASRILDEDLYLSQFFYAYQMQTEESRFTSNVEVEDILIFDNWRKNYAE